MEEKTLIEEESTEKIESVFKNRNFCLLFLGGFVSNLGNVFYNIAISLYIYDLLGNKATIPTLYIATGATVYLIVSPFGGAIVDRIDKVKVVYITDFIRGIAIIVAAYFIFGSYDTVTKLTTLFIITGVLSLNGALFSPALSSLPKYIVDENQLQQAGGVMEGSRSIQTILGLAFGVIIYGALGIGWIFIINGISYILSGISEMFIKVKTIKGKSLITFKVIIRDLVEGYKYITKKRSLKVLMITALFLNFFTAPIMTVGLPYLVKVELEVNNIWLAIFETSFALGAIIMSIFLVSSKQKEKLAKGLKIGLSVLVFIIVIITITLFLYSYEYFTVNHLLISTTVLMFLISLATIYINVPIGVLLQKNTDNDMLGKVFAMLGLMAGAAMPISMAISGVLIDLITLKMVYLICSIGLIIPTVIFAFNKTVNEL